MRSRMRSIARSEFGGTMLVFFARLMPKESIIGASRGFPDCAEGMLWGSTRQRSINVVFGDPRNRRHAHRIAKTEKRLIQGDVNHVVIGHPLQPSALMGRQESDLEVTAPCFEQNLPSAASARRAQASRDPVSSQLRHALFVSHPAECCRVGDLFAFDHFLGFGGMAITHLVNEVLCALLVPPVRVVV